MLDLSIHHEAHALLQYAEVDGADPEPTAVLWADATMAEAMTVVHHAKMLRPEVEGSEWYDDFISAHRYIRRHGIAAATKEVN